MNRSPGRSLRGWAIVAMIGPLALTTGCRNAARRTASAPVRPEYDRSGKLTRLESDADGDGRIDTWGYMDGTELLRVESDENGDGRVDRWEYHARPASAGAQGGRADDPRATIERVERATRFDGKVSRWEYFDRGVVSRIEEDTDGDGAVDTWATYAAGALATLATDTARHGRPDRRLIYRPDGTLDRIEVDADGSGVFHPLPQVPQP